MFSQYETRFDKAYSVVDLEDPREIKDAALTLFGDYYLKNNECVATLSDLEGRIKAIDIEKTQLKKEGFRTTLGRVIRSVGLVALYVLGVATVVPAIVLSIKAKKQITDIWHKYVTYKSLKRIELEDRWEVLRTEASGLKNVTEFRGKLVEGNKNIFLTVPQMISYQNKDELEKNIGHYKADKLSIQNRIDAIQRRFL